jgi:hypothetical protein
VLWTTLVQSVKWVCIIFFKNQSRTHGKITGSDILDSFIGGYQVVIHLKLTASSLFGFCDLNFMIFLRSLPAIHND